MPVYNCGRGNIVAISPEPGVLKMRHQQRTYLAHVAAGTITITCRCCQIPNVIVIEADGTVQARGLVFTSP